MQAGVSAPIAVLAMPDTMAKEKAVKVKENERNVRDSSLCISSIRS